MLACDGAVESSDQGEIICPEGHTQCYDARHASPAHENQASEYRVAEQVNYLGTRRQAELDTFLPALQANPYDPKIIEKCELLPNERYRYVLPSGCAVIWQIESRPEEGTPHSTGDDRVILLLDIAY